MLLKILLIVLLLLSSFFMFFLGFKIYRGGGRSASGCAPEKSLLTSAEPPLKLDAGQSSREDAEKKARERAAAKEEPGVVISGRPQFFAEAGKDVIEGINLENSKKNEGWYYISYEMRLPDGSPAGYEILFSTDMIVPGNVISDVKLSRVLEAGEYACVLHAQPYYMDTLAPTNNADMNVLLTVK